MNKVQLIGRLTRDPELKYTQSTEPVAVTRFSVAVNRKYKRDGEPDADFFNCITFGKTAEFVSKYFSKGKMIGVAGSIRNNSWTDNNGQKRISTEILVDEVEFCGGKTEEKNAQEVVQDDDYYTVDENIDDDNLPL